MKTSELGLSIIKKHESFRPTAYLCPANVWTIGYGHTKGVKKGDTCTTAQADKWLREDAAECEKTISKAASNINQNQFDALVSFAFNVGIGNLQMSTLLKKVRLNSKDSSIREEFMKWCKANGEYNGNDDDGDGLIDEKGEKQTLEGLKKRRKEEADLYFMQ